MPLGIAAYKIFWRVFATNFGVVPLTVVEALPVAVLAVAVLAAANVLAFFPALLAARTRPAQLLRAATDIRPAEVPATSVERSGQGAVSCQRWRSSASASGTTSPCARNRAVPPSGITSSRT